MKRSVVVVNAQRQRLTIKTVLEPCEYVQSMPSKGVRNSAIDALDVWYEVPESSLEAIRSIVNTLHNSSLMYAGLNPALLQYKG